MPYDIFSAIRVLYCLSNLVGLYPFSCVTEDKSRARKWKRIIRVCSWYGRLHTIIMIIFVIIGAAVMMVWRISYSYPRIQSITVLITDLTLLLVTCLVAVVSLVKCVTGSHRAFSSMLASISHVDEVLVYQSEDIGKNSDILQASQVSYFLLYEVLFYYFQYTVWANEHGSKNRNHIPISCIIHAVICVMEIQYFYLVLMLKRRFSALNSHFVSVPASHTTLNRIVESGMNSRIRTAGNSILERQFKVGAPNKQNYAISAAINYSTREWQQNLYKLRCANDILNDAVAAVSSAYGLQILLSMTMSFLSVTTCLYFGIGFATKLREEEEDIEGKHQSALVFSLIWAAVGIFRIFTITSTCNAVSGEASRTSVLLQKLLLEPSLYPDTATEIQLFLQQIRIRPVKFTAWDFFTIGHSTTCSFTGAIVTYLVILLQFHS
jgi:hypothetical protein